MRRSYFQNFVRNYFHSHRIKLLDSRHITNHILRLRPLLPTSPSFAHKRFELLMHIGVLESVFPDVNLSFHTSQNQFATYIAPQLFTAEHGAPPLGSLITILSCHFCLVHMSTVGNIFKYRRNPISRSQRPRLRFPVKLRLFVNKKDSTFLLSIFLPPFACGFTPSPRDSR